jgi:hypothetical protein
MNKWQSQRELAGWLNNYSISTSAFEKSSTDLLRAQITAKGTLDHYSYLLTQDQTQSLKAYCLDFANPASRKHITTHQTHQVLNIGNKVRRKIFKQRKSFN